MGTTLSADELTHRARLAVHASWVSSPDGVARTAKARRAYIESFETEVDPDGVLDPEDRARRASHLRKAAFARAAFESLKARRLAQEVTDAASATP